MRVSIWIGLPVLALGILFSYLAKAIIQTPAITQLQTAAFITATVIFLLISAIFLGSGAAMVIHWIAGFVRHFKAFVAEIFLSFAVFFVGIGVTIMSRNGWQALHLFFTFLTGSMTLFFLSFISLFGSLKEGFTLWTKRFKKAVKKRWGT